MSQQETEHGGAIGFRDYLKLIPRFFWPFPSSERLGWVGVEANRCRETPAYELKLPALTYHRLVLYTHPPDEFELRYEGVKRNVPPPAGSISLIPAGVAAEVRSSGKKDELHAYLESGLVARVAVEVFDVDPARLTLPPLDGLYLPQLRPTMLAVKEELMANGAGGPLAAESLANLLAVHLVRYVFGVRPPTDRSDGALPQRKLRAVVEYIEEHLGARPSLEVLAKVAHLSVYHFARQFKVATGLPPHQYLILRRVERAKLLLQAGDLALAEIAAGIGFTDQSKFSNHFKRIVGVSPKEFRLSAGID
jgi:AraC family transcriptional regulator